MNGGKKLMHGARVRNDCWQKKNSVINDRNSVWVLLMKTFVFNTEF